MTVATSKNNKVKGYFNVAKERYEFFTRKNHKYVPVSNRVTSAKAATKLVNELETKLYRARASR